MVGQKYFFEICFFNFDFHLLTYFQIDSQVTFKANNYLTSEILWHFPFQDISLCAF